MYKYLLLFLPLIMLSQKYETQKYDVIKTVDTFEIRYYPPTIKARVSSNRNFSKLFKYISGNNEKNEKIAMTTPVYMSKKEEKITMEFVMPSKYSEKNMIQPNDKDIVIYRSMPGYYASISFGGYASVKKVNAYYALLLDKAKGSKLKILGEDPISLSYNSPYKVFNRRNEVLIEIEYPKN